MVVPLCGNHSGRQEVRQGGFSLIEMMVVVAIMAIILSVGLPAFSSWRESTALHSAEETLMGHLKQARLMAVAKNRTVNVVFASGSYTVDSGGSNQQKYVLSQYSKNLTLTSTFPGTPSTLIFSSSGTTNIAATKDTVTLSNGNGTTRTISVNTVGRAYLQ